MTPSNVHKLFLYLANVKPVDSLTIAGGITHGEALEIVRREKDRRPPRYKSIPDTLPRHIAAIRKLLPLAKSKNQAVPEQQLNQILDRIEKEIA